MSAAFSRRSFLVASGAGAASLLGIGALSSCATQSPSYILAADAEVQEYEANRVQSGRTVRHRLISESGLVSTGSGPRVATWGYREHAALAAVGPTIHASRGDRLVVETENLLGEETSVHWHGLRIRNDMDGAPPDTQAPIDPGARFTYDFTLPDHGTYWYHSHTGLQADRSLFGALVVEDPDDRSGADEEFVLVLDDWLLDTTSPEEVLQALGADGSGGHSHGAPTASAPPGASAAASALVSGGMGDSALLGGPTQHLSYPAHLVNGRTTEDPVRFTARPGATVRLRVVNAAAETPYRIALAGHRLTVIAADGFDTRPHTTDAVLIAPAQRIDLLVELASGAWPFVARVEGKPGAALAILSTSDAAHPPAIGEAATHIPELDREVATDAALFPAESAVLDERDPDRIWELELIELPGGYVWGISGADAATLQPRCGERIRIEMVNRSSMWHPMHLHGHTFASRRHNGLRRDTEIVLPGETAILDFDADNPGRWMIHCHNAYHFAAGMVAPIRYVR